MNRLPALLAFLTYLGVVAGCAQTCLNRDCGWKEIYSRADLPPHSDCNPADLDRLLAPPGADIPEPANILAPERAPHYLTLAEAFAMALENGTVGLQASRNPGLPVDDLVGFSGNGTFGSDSIRVLALQPARAGTNIDAALSRFDPQFISGVAWTSTDEPTQGLSTFANGETANFFATLAKPLPTGGVVGLTYSTDYSLLTAPFGGPNPAYIPRLQFGFEQPLLRGFGTEINQLLGTFPGSNLFPAIGNRANSFANEGILITRLRLDQQRAELERNVNYLLLNVEAAYWTLYGSYVNLYANEQGLRQSHDAWVRFKTRAEVGQGVGIGQLAQVRAQYEQFRGDRMRAVGLIIDNERNLRMLLGMPVEDGKRLVPIDAPTTAPVHTDWKAALEDALARRPELILARQEVKARQWNLVVQKNFMLPDLRLQATHTTVGLGSRLDGSGTFLDANGLPVTSNALHSLAGGHFNDWTVGLTLNVPLGFRHEHAQLRDARLQIAQAYATLKNQELKATTFLARAYSRVIESAQVLEVRRLQREAEGEQLRVRSEAFAEGSKLSPIEFVLSAQQQFASSLNSEYQAIVDYNIALATLEFARGSIMEHSRVSIADGPLPGCAVRAVDHEHRKALAAVRDRVHARRPVIIDDPLPPLPLYGAATLLELNQTPEPPIATLSPPMVTPTPPMAMPTPPIVTSSPPPIAPVVSTRPAIREKHDPNASPPPSRVRGPLFAPPFELIPPLSDPAAPPRSEFGIPGLPPARPELEPIVPLP